MQSEEGSQIAVNFKDLDLAEPDFEMNCVTEYLELKESQNLPSSYLGSDGKKLCGKRVPNYPGPSVIVSGEIKLIPHKLLLIIFLPQDLIN